MVIEPIEQPHEAPPARVGRYEVVAALGHGGMARVYLVRGLGSAGFERLAAMKVLHHGLCSDQEFVEMFFDEARVAAGLHHPNTAAIVDLGATGPQPYMVMDYIEGDTLHAVQRAATSVRGAIPVGITLRVVLDALAGLDAAHELRGPTGAPLGLIHRDVSPHNILVGIDGVARLVDFGIARAASRRGITAVGVVKGNLPFMAPEQIRGYGVDRRADVFSMGVTLWEALTLRRCFPMREGARLSRLAREDYRPLAEVAPKVPAALDAICRKALAFDPADRFATAAAFTTAIEEAFRHDLATQRELAQFMSVVAAHKVRREREAVRRSAQPVPHGAVGGSSAASSAADRRGRFFPVAPRSQPADPAPASPFFGPETHPPVAPWQHRVRRAGKALRTWALPPLPPRVATRRFGAPPVAPAPDVAAGSLYEALTEALFRRRETARAASVPLVEWVTRRMRAVAPLPESFGSVITRRLPRASGRPRLSAAPPPVGLDGPTVPRRAFRLRALPSLQPPPPPGDLLAPFRALMMRLWMHLAT